MTDYQQSMAKCKEILVQWTVSEDEMAKLYADYALRYEGINKKVKVLAGFFTVATVVLVGVAMTGVSWVLPGIAAVLMAAFWGLLFMNKRAMATMTASRGEGRFFLGRDSEGHLRLNDFVLQKEASSLENFYFSARIEGDRMLIDAYGRVPKQGFVLRSCNPIPMARDQQAEIERHLKEAGF